jgi:mannose-6-phosphate isomerase-like protein (cupin superfamily)
MACCAFDFRDGAVYVSAGEMFVVPRGVEHQPYAEHEVKLLLVEPRGVLNNLHVRLRLSKPPASCWRARARFAAA